MRTREQVATREESRQIWIPRGIPGLELGMSLQQVRASFNLAEALDSADEAGKREIKPTQKRFFRLAPTKGHLLEGISGVEATFAGEVLYNISLQYAEEYEKTVGWQGITYQYLAKFGKPSTDEKSSYGWQDYRTRVQLSWGFAALSDVDKKKFMDDLFMRKSLKEIPSQAPSLVSVKVIYTDLAVETAVKKAEAAETRTVDEIIKEFMDMERSRSGKK
jgi:hypothetical protein